MPDLRAIDKKCYGSRTLLQPPAVTHKVIHTKCAELLVNDSWKISLFPCCLKFTHGKYSVIYQWVRVKATRLHTILSTEHVQNWWLVLRSQMRSPFWLANHGDNFYCWRALPDFYPCALNVMKSMVWVAIIGLANNLIHIKCAKVGLRRR